MDFYSKYWEKNTAALSLTEKQKEYQTPYVIGQTMIPTETEDFQFNYLGSYVLKLAGGNCLLIIRHPQDKGEASGHWNGEVYCDEEGVTGILRRSFRRSIRIWYQNTKHHAVQRSV